MSSPQGFMKEGDEKPESLIALTSHDVDLFIDGTIKQEPFYFDKVSSLRSDYHDSYTFVRSKSDIGFHAEYGRETFGDVAVTGDVRVTAYHYWNDNSAYLGIEESEVFAQPKDIFGKISISDHTHNVAAPLIYLEKASITVDWDVFMKNLSLPITTKVGLFKYKVGRGIALGDYVGGAVNYLGWNEPNHIGNESQEPVGALVSFDLTPQCSLDFYISRMTALATSPRTTRAPIKSHLLSLDMSSKDPRDVERGSLNDTTIYAAQLDFEGTVKACKIAANPYIVHVSAPEQKLEIIGDANARLTTIGAMGKISGKTFEVNVEAAAQFGHQDIHAIDRLGAEFSVRNYPKETGNQSLAECTHLYSDLAKLEKAPYFDDLMEVAHQPHNRSVDAAGTKILKRDGSDYTLPGGSTTVYNAPQLPYGGRARFTQPYRVNYRGYMALADAMMAVSKRARVGVCGGVISGDDYPYNTQEDKTYSGFVPLRDQNYFGEHVRSFAVLYARKLPRPTNMSDEKLYSFNNDEDVSNLRFFGIGAQWMPLKHPKQLIVMPSLFAFWQDCAPFKWDKDAVRSFSDSTAQAYYPVFQNKVGMTGAQTTQRARSYLGTELSMCLIWNPLESLEVDLIGSLFIPGGLYNDIDGMPNRNTRRYTADGSVVYESLGSETVIGGLVRCKYRF